MAKLPEGFALDQPGVPYGFSLDQPETTLLEDVGAGIKAGASIATGALAEPVGGLSGIVQAINPFAEEGAGARAADYVSDLLTFETDDPRAREFLGNVGAVVEKGTQAVNVPISGLAGLVQLAQGKSFKQASDTVKNVQKKGTSKALGDSVFELTGSPLLATAAETAPAALLEVVALKGIKLPKKGRLPSDVGEAITAAAPDVAKLKGRSRSLFKEVDDFGTKIKPQIYDAFVNNLSVKLKKSGLRPNRPQLAPKSNEVLNTFIDDKGTAKTFSDLKDLREIAKSAANTMDANDARLGKIIISELDRGIDQLADTFIKQGAPVGQKLKDARELWRRARSSELITDMIEDASLSASGMENGLRIGSRQILKNRKKRKFLTGDERKALREIVQGSGAGNAAKFLGKFGISEGQATSMLGASIGVAGGAAMGGPVGAATVATLGQRAKKAAQRITVKNAIFSDELIRAGNDAKKITSAYLKNTPKTQRRVADLTELLLDPDVDLTALKAPKDMLLLDAAFFANEIRRKAQNVGATGTIISQTVKDDENE